MSNSFITTGNDRNKASDFSDLQKNIAIVIARIGLEKTILLLQSFVSNTSLSIQRAPRIKLITTFCIAKSCEVFGLDEKLFYLDRTQKYSQARTACFHLLKRHTAYTYSEIGEATGKSKRTILYYYKQGEDLLSIQQYYPAYMEKYDLLENHVLDFLSKIN